MSGVGAQKEGKEQESMEREMRRRGPQGKIGAEEVMRKCDYCHTLSTANVTIVLIKEDRKEGRVGEITVQPPLAWQCGLCTRAVQTQLGQCTMATPGQQ